MINGVKVICEKKEPEWGGLTRGIVSKYGTFPAAVNTRLKTTGLFLQR